VLDASRAVGVASNLMSDTLRTDYVDAMREEYRALRASRAGAAGERVQPIEAARRARPQVAWTPAPAPTFTGVRLFDDYPLPELVERIDWTPFFQTWELRGHYPAILTDPEVGKAASSLFADAQRMLARIVDQKQLRARGAVAFHPARAVGDDVELLDARGGVLATLYTLRQQMAKAEGRANYALADFVAPAAEGVPDYVGLFAVTAGAGLSDLIAGYRAAQDDYSAILAEALADRLAEAFAERLHERVRKELWGYAADEQLGNAELIREAYQGIRPAPGYPACPDHTEKRTIFQLLGAADVGIELTESCAMLPGASVSGYYFWRPEARYFGLGKIGKDQVEDYARRKGWTLAEAERWLAPNLGYDR
jgi:5-methyltetrahydrofolate--homocysteine methyltransferase